MIFNEMINKLRLGTLKKKNKKKKNKKTIRRYSFKELNIGLA